MINVNALGDACPIPVVKTKKAIAELQGAGEVCVLVDNEIAVQNLTKMAQQKGYAVKSEKLEAKKYQVVLSIGEALAEEAVQEECVECVSNIKANKVVVISSDKMGEGDDVLGALLMKGFVFALTQQLSLIHI